MKSFTISPPIGDPPTLKGNTGNVVFTVTNTATRTVDGTALAQPQPPAEVGWFSFPDGATRTYEPGAVMSVGVTVTAPAGTPAGTYTFRLDVKAEDNPDEDYTEGPSAQFVLAEAPKPVPWWKRYWWILAIVAVVLIGIVVAVLLLSGGDDGGGGGGDAGLPERNCLAYDPASVSVQDLGAAGFALDSGAGRLAVLDNAQDADQGRLLAKAHNKRCRIGAGANAVDYWLGEGGGPRPPQRDCLPYDPSALTIVDESPNGFLLADGSSRMEVLDTRPEADDMLKIAKAFSNQCFIGRDNQRANRRDFIVTYWE